MILESQYSSAAYWIGAVIVLSSFIFINYETAKATDDDEDDDDDDDDDPAHKVVAVVADGEDRDASELSPISSLPFPSPALSSFSSSSSSSSPQSRSRFPTDRFVPAEVATGDAPSR